MDERASPSFFLIFYARRFFRIIPIYYLWTTLYIVLVVGAGPFLKAHAHSGMTPELGWPIYIHYLFLQNFGLASLVGLAGAWFGPTWSLAIEEQFYVVAPAIIRLVSPRRMSAVLIFTIVAIPVMRTLMLWAGHPSVPIISKLMICRGDALAIGILAALLWRRPEFHAWAAGHARLLYTVLASFMAGFGALWKWAPEAQTYGMESVGFTVTALTYGMVLLLALLRPCGPIAVIARMRWLRDGACTPRYRCTWGEPVCLMVRSAATPRVSTPKGLVVSLLAALATCALAGASWILLENPLLRRGHRYKYHNVSMLSPAVASAAASQ